MAQTVVEQKRPRGDKSTGSLSRLKRDLKAYELHMTGCTVRGICDELKISSTQTAHSAINRGRDYCIERGINVDERKIEIDKLFKVTLGALAEEIQIQRKEGRVTLISRNDGSEEVRRIKGIDPRTAEALARSADRWAQFLGLTDRAAETTQANTTLIQLSAPGDGANFADRWGSDAKASDHGSDQVGSPVDAKSLSSAAVTE